MFPKGRCVSISLPHACNLLATTDLAPEKLSFQTFLQDLSQEYFETWFMQQRDDLQTTKRTENC